jgi:hypothetical protein
VSDQPNKYRAGVIIVTSLRKPMKDYTAQPIELESAMTAYLEEVAKKYALPDAAKAVRCLINYARENPDRRDEIFSEVRCTGC